VCGPGVVVQTLAQRPLGRPPSLFKTSKLCSGPAEHHLAGRFHLRFHTPDVRKSLLAKGHARIPAGWGVLLADT